MGPCLSLPVRLSLSMFLAFQRFPVSDRSPVADLCLSYRLRLCLSPFGYPASSWTAYPCTDLYRIPNGLRHCLFRVWIPCPIIDCLPVYRPWTDLTTNSAAVFLYLDLYTCVWTADTCTKSETVKRFNCTYLCLLVVRLDPQSLLKALQYRLEDVVGGRATAGVLVYRPGAGVGECGGSGCWSVWYMAGTVADRKSVV